MVFVPQRLPTLTTSAPGCGQLENRRRNQIVVQNHIGGLNQAQGLDGEQVGIAGACADEEHFACVALFGSACAPTGLRRASRCELNRRSGAAPARCSRALRSSPRGCVARTSRRSSPRFPSHGPRSSGKLRVDFAAQPLRNRRAFAGRGDRDLQIAAAAPRSRRRNRSVGMSSTLLHEDSPADRFAIDRRVDFGIVGRGDDEKLPSRSAGSNARWTHSSLPSAQAARISGCASGATTRRRRPVFSRLPIFSSATLPAPTSRPGRPSSFRKMGSRLIGDPQSATACGTRPVGRSRSTGARDFAGKIGAQFVVGMARKPGAQIFVRLARPPGTGAAGAQSLREPAARAAIADRARDAGVLANRSAEAEVVSIDELAFVLDLLAFDADVGDPVLAAAVGAAGDVQPQLLIELRQALFKLVDQPAREALGLGDGQLAEFGARAGDGAAPEGRAFHVQADGAKFAHQLRRLSRSGRR